MTLIAALLNHGTPVLIGDVMLSSRGAKNHSPLPTIRHLQILSQDKETRVAGVHRKLCIVNPHLVVGWTGRVDVAAHLLLNLIDTLRGRQTELDPDLLWKTLDDSWAAGVQSEPEIENIDITLLGWMIDREGFINAFEWSKERKILHGCKDVIAKGSGAEDFIELINSSEPTAKEDEHNLTRIAMDLVSVVACLLGRELGTGANISSFYGGGYDIVMLTEGGFRFLDSILYVPVVVENIEDEWCQAIQPTFFLKFSYADGNLLILRRTIKLDKEGAGIGQETDISIVGKFGESRYDLEQLDINSHTSLSASIVALIFMADTAHQCCIYAPFVGAGNSEQFQFTNDKLRINMDVTKKMIPLIHNLATQSEQNGI